MRRQIFLYLFLFALLLLIFQYMNEKSIFEAQENRINSLTNQVDKLKDSLESEGEKVAELNYFTLQGNENAMTYLEKSGHNPEELEAYISGWIYDQNVVAENNPLVPYEGMHSGMKINKIRFLNHKWILADFTDGIYWGEMLLEFYVNPEGEIDLQHLGSLIYPE